MARITDGARQLGRWSRERGLASAARLLGLDRSTLWRLVLGSQVPTAQQRKVIFEVAGISSSDWSAPASAGSGAP